jgi:DNA primase large subunit
MIRQDFNRVDPKRRANLNHRKAQFTTATYKTQDYPHRLNFYETPPTAEITLEEFEQWAIDRLKSECELSLCCLAGFGMRADCSILVLAELEACSFRNKNPAETAAHIKPLLQKYLPLYPNTSSASGIVDQKLKAERQKDHYSHFILRLAFSGTEDLRRRFARIETALFRLRFQNDDSRERQAFVKGLNFDWEVVGDEEKEELREQLLAATPGFRRGEEESWFKVEWERVPELVEQRLVLLKKGKAYVPIQEQASMVLAEFGKRLEKGLEVYTDCSDALDLLY